eukprot:CAMPEP_0117505678 /NCGR_PEP_ID=MMETSP0784-20121206/25508_1 /TAXON_ID=39447 /ORGANISM="" /LENGTH=332 /DNA_ID=CAMNT_0005301111 /DNA_START=54 /DNA_END=1052 /DNA_ORIENTATION=-
MVGANLSGAFNAFYRQHQFPKPDPSSDDNSMAGLDPAAAGLGRGDIVFCQLSPLHRLTLDSETKRAANIPDAAVFFAWAYPMVCDGSLQVSAESPEGAFLQFGGYIYFDECRDAVGTNAIRPAALGTIGLMFGRPQRLPPVVVETLSKQGRFQEITLEVLATKGATHFAWIRPREFDGVACADGCFAYLFGASPAKYYPVVSRPVFTPELLQEELDDDEAWVVVRNAGSQPELEAPIVFDRRATFEANAQNNQLIAPPEVDMANLVVTKDSGTAALAYSAWQHSDDKGTIVDPWVIELPRAGGGQAEDEVSPAGGATNEGAYLDPQAESLCE